jgi:hypothetical protein
MNADTATLPSGLHPEPDVARTHEKPRSTEDASRSLAGELLRAPATMSWGREATRLAIGLLLAAVFGACLGLRTGGGALAVHALGVAAGLAAVAGVAAPSFAIILALVNAPMDAYALARATSGAVARAGLMLGGLAPAAALYVVTVEDAITVTVVALGALGLAGAVGVSSFAEDLKAPLARSTESTRRWMTIAMPLFLAFATLLALRVWWLALPVLPGGLR